MIRRWFLWGKFIFLGCFLSFTLSLIFTGVCVKASEFDDFYYYGPVVNSYSQYNSSGRKFYLYPSGVFCYQIKYFDKQYICIACPYYSLVNDGSNNWGLYRQYTQFNSEGNFVSAVNNNFFQMEGYSSDLIVDVDGQDFIVRSMEITDNIVDCPYFMVYSNRLDGAKSALLGYVKGVKSFTSGGVIDANVSVDLSGVENSLSDISASGNAISDNSSAILQVLQSDSEVIDNSVDIKAIRLFVFLCFLILTATLFRNIFSQWVRNTRKGR